MRNVANFPLSASHPLNRALLATVLDPGGPRILHRMNPILHGLVVDDKLVGNGILQVVRPILWTNFLPICQMFEW